MPEGPAAFDPERIVVTLLDFDVTFMIVGGFSTRLFGAQRITADLDLIPSGDRANLERLGNALRELNVRLRIGGVSDEIAMTLARPNHPDVFKNSSSTTCTTDAGDLDVLMQMADRDGELHGFEYFEPRAQLVDIDGRQVLVAALEDVIASKEHADRNKDREALPELRILLARSTSSTPESGAVESSVQWPPSDLTL